MQVLQDEHEEMSGAQSHLLERGGPDHDLNVGELGGATAPKDEGKIRSDFNSWHTHTKCRDRWLELLVDDLPGILFCEDKIIRPWHSYVHGTPL